MNLPAELVFVAVAVVRSMQLNAAGALAVSQAI